MGLLHCAACTALTARFRPAQLICTVRWCIEHGTDVGDRIRRTDEVDADRIDDVSLRSGCTTRT